MTKTRNVLAGALLAASLMGAETYKIDAAHSSAQFAVKHMMVSNVRGEMGNLSGTVLYDPTNLAGSKIDASIDVSTLTTHDPDRDKHLKSPDFFNVEKFPTITFKSKQFTKTGDKVQIVGDLTIHGVTKEVTLTVDGPTEENKDPWGNMRRGASATTTVNRKDFGLTWNKALESGGVLVGDQVQITLDIEGVRKG